MVARNPYILIVDDDYEQQGAPRARRISKRGIVRAEARHPDDVTKQQLKAASVVLIDYKLDVWPGREETKSPSLKPENGVALAGVLRGHIPEDACSAICILSNQLKQLYGSLTPENRRHVLARVHSLEWIFDKDDSRLSEQVEELAKAVSRMTATSPDSERHMMKLLGLSAGVKFAAVAQDEVRRCIPPIDELNELTHGLSFLRWFLQRVLPYPTFLIDENALAAQLRIDVPTLSKIRAKDTAFSRRLREVEYSGILSQFLGTRWWRAGVVDLVWSVGKEGALSTPAWIARLTKASRVPIKKASTFVDPVVTVDDDFASTSEIIPRSEAVRIVPDDWPSYSDAAFVTIERARRERHLRDIVHVDDEWRLEAAA
jgi:hypothetical protein